MKESLHLQDKVYKQQLHKSKLRSLAYEVTLYLSDRPTLLEETGQCAATYNEVGKRRVREVVGEHLNLLRSWMKTGCLQSKERRNHL